MKNILVILFLLWSSTTMFAQSNDSVSENIQLTDGSVLKGKIIKTDTENNLVYIALNSGGEITVAANTVVEAKVQKGTFHRLANGKSVQKTGFYLIPQFYTLSARRSKSWEGDDNDIRHAVGISLTAGHQFTNYLAVGGGFGADLYEDVLMPVFLDIRGNIGHGNLTPYYAINVGYGFPLGNWLTDDEFSSANHGKGGKFIYPALGLKLATRSLVAFQMDVGYNFQQNERDLASWWGNDAIERVWYKSLAIRVGVSF